MLLGFFDSLSSYLQPGLFDFEAYFSYSSALFSNLVRALIAVMCNFGQLKHTIR